MINRLLDKIKHHFKSETYLSFHDVLMLPRFSRILSRRLTSVASPATELVEAVLNRHNRLRVLPVIPSSMDTIVSTKMLASAVLHGGFAFSHRYQSPAEQIKQHKEATGLIKRSLSRKKKRTKNMVNCPCFEQDDKHYVLRESKMMLSEMDSELVNVLLGASVGASLGPERARIKALIEKAGVFTFNIDVAHGHHELVGDVIRYIRSLRKDAIIFAGNVVTSEGADYLYRAGADFVKINIGGGSICSTRVVTGVGAPSFTALVNIAKWRDAHAPSLYLVLDGGMRSSGDIAKALMAGADLVMTGFMFKGISDTPGKVIRIGNWKYKTYRGMASKDAQYANGKTQNVVSEGVSVYVPYSEATFHDVLVDIIGALQSTLSYLGVDSILDGRKVVEFIRITEGGVYESIPHILKQTGAIADRV
jgi:IMP dehydrogenase